MQRPSPPPSRSVLDRALVGQICVAGVLVSVASLAAGLWAKHHGHDVQTAVFLTLGLGQLTVALALRAPRSRPVWRWSWHERGLEGAVLVAGAWQLAGVAVPGLRSLLGTDAPGGAELLWLLVVATLPGLAVAGAGRWWDRGRKSRSGRPLAPVPGGRGGV
jgi:Ca2+-transporting ATPase